MLNNYAPRNPQWYVGRAFNWPDGYVVKITDGICGQGCNLMQPTNRRLEGYHDTAVAAAQAAIELWLDWRTAMPGVPINFGYDDAVDTVANQAEFETVVTAVLTWAAAADAKLIRCCSCGEVLDANYYYNDVDDVFCSGRCLARNESRLARLAGDESPF